MPCAKHLRAKDKPSFLRDADGRTVQYRRAKRCYDDLVDRLGGINKVQPYQLDLIERYVFLREDIREREAAAAAGGEIDQARHVQHVNLMLSLLRQLGLEGPTKPTHKPNGRHPLCEDESC